ncbi:MAG: hypothetical protein NC114_10840 [Ruminococcus flavefaciens]|nr:hypothetical protein [Ruminococcus flavefaciens]
MSFKGLFHLTANYPTMPEHIMNALPPYIRPIGERFGCLQFVNIRNNMVILFSTDQDENGQLYHHVSCSFRNRIPNWNELHGVKNLFIGKDRTAFIFFPPESEYLNLHPNCLHLWSSVIDV